MVDSSNNLALICILFKLKCRDTLQKIVLIEIFTNNEYNEMIFNALEEHIMKETKNKNSLVMDFWQIFVMAQF
jgi:hypothetical protein